MNKSWEYIVNQVRGTSHFGFTWITESYGVGALIEVEEILDTLNSNTAVINMAKEINAEKVFKNVNIEYVHIPLDNGAKIPFNIMNEIVYKAGDFIAGGKKVIFFCYGGMNRSIIALTASLMNGKSNPDLNLSYESAISLILSIRKVASPLPQLLRSLQNFYHITPVEIVFDYTIKKFSDSNDKLSKNSNGVMVREKIEEINALLQKIVNLNNDIENQWNLFNSVKNSDWKYGYAILVAINRMFVIQDIDIRNLILISNNIRILPSYLTTMMATELDKIKKMKREITELQLDDFIYD